MEELAIKNLEKRIEKLTTYYNVARKNHFSNVSYQIFEDIMSLKNTIAGMKLRGVE